MDQATDSGADPLQSAGSSATEHGPKVISVLGATGSVGDSSLDIISSSPDRYRVGAVTANGNVEKLAQIAIETKAGFAAVADEQCLDALKDALSGTGIAVGAGEAGLAEAAAWPADMVVGAIVGAAGIRPTMAALEAGNQVALANKEALVCAGDLVMDAARRLGKPILPVDSEHSAIFQIFDDANRDEIEDVTITASGGPFRTWAQGDIEKATPEQALNHPNWSMGAKVTIDSASLMNKGLEVIEAHHLYDMPLEKLKVIVHPQSIIHGLVTYSDGSMLAHLGAADMRIPVAHCLAWPDRAPANTRRISLVEIAQLTFEAPDMARFPCLGLALEALRVGGNLPNIMNAANEVAVAAFLDHQLPFGGIARMVEAVMDRFVQLGEVGPVGSVDAVLATDAAARCVADEVRANLV
ncbi:1-deoxy-D-xylulose-5-phosphate reductoisomerase [Cohaesibacter intestini]|uniref:1-deoxy-D-xylulose-5-phosphate reductoisomerase n=1 Tax=Cohaesibacter intestini TaxID=2211145 RepID=UPI000DEAF023|nr:1-deoxy-D-xylulose-5-phosphate reductoisomerase [Cohaesibacter intestini]